LRSLIFNLKNPNNIYDVIFLSKFVIFTFDSWPYFSFNLVQFEVLEYFLYPRPDLLLDFWPIALSKSIEVMLVEVYENLSALFSVSTVYTFTFNVATSPKCIW
jgi:hypothetical protein